MPRKRSMTTGYSMKLRPMTIDDLDAANAVVEAAIMTWSVSDRVKRLSLPSYRYQPHDLDHLTLRVAEGAAGEVIGVAAWEPAEAADAPQAARALLLHGIYVETDLQGKGIGSRLLDASIQAARQGGFEGLLVRANPDAAGFFSARGLAHLPVEDPVRDYPHRNWLALGSET